MKKLISTCIYLGTFISAFSQTTVSQPLKFNVPVEAQEFFIYTTISSGDDQLPAQMVNGYFDNTPGTPPNQFIKSGNTFTTGINNSDVYGNRSMNVIAIDHDGDGYDNIAAAHERPIGFNIMWPNVDKNNLALSDDSWFWIDNKAEFEVDEPTIKLAKADFNGDRKEELVIAYRKYDTEKIIIEVRQYSPSATGQIEAIDYAPLIGQHEHYEAFDVTADDFDGDGIPEIALYSIVNDGGQRKQRIGIYQAEPSSQPWLWEITARGSLTFGTVNPGNNAWENMAITSGIFNPDIAPKKQLAGIINYKDGMNMVENIFTATVEDLDNITIHSSGSITNTFPNASPVALSLASGDMNNDDSEEIIRARNAEFQIFDSDGTNTLTAKAQGGSGIVDNDFYLLVRNGSYLTIGDADMDGVNDIFTVTTSYDGQNQSFKLDVSHTNQELNTITTKGSDGNFLSVENNCGGSNCFYRYAATFAEFRGGRAILRAPIIKNRKLITPLIVNNTPPHHFDVIDGEVLDVNNCFPGFTCNSFPEAMNTQYSETNSNEQTITSTLKSDWNVSATVSAEGGTKVAQFKAAATAKYGKAFEETNSHTTTETISADVVADSDDQILAAIQDVDVYEYPIDSSNVIIGYILAIIRSGDVAMINWSPSKSQNLVDFIPDHEVGNLFSYSSAADFIQTNKVIEPIIKTTPNGATIGSSGLLGFSMGFDDIMMSGASQEENFGAEISASGSYYGVGLSVDGNYNQSNFTSHTSTALNSIKYTANMMSPLNPEYGDAEYDIKPYVYWGKNGAVNLNYSVDLADPIAGGDNFWTTYYGEKPDLTLMLPWRLDEEKGLSLGSFIDKKRLCKSIVLDKVNFIPGDTVTITAFIENYSLLDYDGEVGFEFYAGNPDLGGTLLSDVNGSNSLVINNLFKSRERTPIEFKWKVGNGISAGPRIYIVIDPENQIDEVHEDNNIGFKPLGNNVLSADDETLFSNTIDNAKIFPNPVSSARAQIELELPEYGNLEIELFDISGKNIQTLFNNDLPAGEYIIPIDLMDVRPGAYLVKIKINNHLKTLKLMKMG